MLIFVLAYICATETSLHGKNIWDSELFEHGYPGSLFFVFAHTESTLFEREKVAKLRHDVWEHSCLTGHFFDVISVHEYILLSTMAVQVAVQYYFPFFLKSSHDSLNI